MFMKNLPYFKTNFQTYLINFFLLYIIYLSLFTVDIKILDDKQISATLM